MHVWIVMYTIVFQNGKRWEKERTTRADDIAEASRNANAIMQKARELPLVARVELKAIIREDRRRR